MGIVMDLVHGFIAVIGLIIGRVIGEALVGSSSLVALILAIIGLAITGWGLKMRGFGGAFVVGLGLGLASPITILIGKY